MPAPKGNDFAKGNDGGAPKGNGNAETHGMTADSRKWFDRHRDEVGDRVRQKVARAVDHVPFSWDNLMKMELLVEAAINQEQVRYGDEYIHEHGIIREEVTPTGDTVVVRDEESPASLQKSRLQRDTIRLLKELGYLDDPASQQAESMKTVAEILSPTSEDEAPEPAIEPATESRSGTDTDSERTDEEGDMMSGSSVGFNGPDNS